MSASSDPRSSSSSNSNSESSLSVSGSPATIPDLLIPFDDVGATVNLIMSNERHLQSFNQFISNSSAQPEAKRSELRDLLKQWQKSMAVCASQKYKAHVITRAREMIPEDMVKRRLHPTTIGDILKTIHEGSKTLPEFFRLAAGILILPLKHSHLWMHDAKALFEEKQSIKIGATRTGARSDNFSKYANKLQTDKIETRLNRFLKKWFSAKFNKCEPAPNKHWDKPILIVVKCARFEGEGKAPLKLWIREKSLQLEASSSTDIITAAVVKFKNQGVTREKLLGIVRSVYNSAAGVGAMVSRPSSFFILMLITHVHNHVDSLHTSGALR